jgi:hypothetical protein
LIPELVLQSSIPYVTVGVVNIEYEGNVLKTEPGIFRAVFRVARWYIFIPKIQIWINFEGLGMDNV